ncbi:GtrA family protein [Acinetobacter sp. ESL0695]|uniref:GtrA family protein n=1 Tax=Acinetobacter sp. ESL0695 TaxID=2983215 RepID=UPI0023F4D3C9|nr:GtrA family protein [Acinetobacter sp. ESL0695]WEV48537.1 GtrA family protein [Acinetobacter sp. ESL0695]
MFELIRFFCVGICAALTHYFIVICLYQYFSIALSLSNFIAFCIALWVSYFGHKYFTFRTQTQNSGHTFLKFILVATIGFLFNEGLLLIGHAIFHTAPIQWIVIVAIFLTAILTFILNKFFTFKILE